MAGGRGVLRMCCLQYLLPPQSANHHSRLAVGTVDLFPVFDLRPDYPDHMAFEQSATATIAASVFGQCFGPTLHTSVLSSGRAYRAPYAFIIGYDRGMGKVFLAVGLVVSAGAGASGATWTIPDRGWCDRAKRKMCWCLGARMNDGRSLVLVLVLVRVGAVPIGAGA